MRFFVLKLIALVGCCLTSPTNLFAQHYQLEVEGAPGYDGNSGFMVRGNTKVNRNGVGAAQAYSILNGNDAGYVALRWEFGGNGQPLGSISINPGFFGEVFDINDLGQVVGIEDIGNLTGSVFDKAALLWTGSATPIQLGSLSSGGPGQRDYAYAINNSGIIVGSSRLDNSNQSAVRWSTTDTAPVQLDTLGMSTTGGFNAAAGTVNSAGTIAGAATKYDANGGLIGSFAVKWAANGTAVTELGTASRNGFISSYYAIKINDSDVIAGSSYDLDFVNGTQSTRAMRWDAAGNASELGNLGVNADGESHSTVFDINSHGDVVGLTEKYDSSGGYFGVRAVRWSANSNSAEELGAFGSMDGTVFDSAAYGVNNAGLAVGFSAKLNPVTNFLDHKAVIWLPNGRILDLNSLDVVPEGGEAGEWDLQSVHSITNNGWIGGSGYFTPDIGNGYERSWIARLGLGGRWVNSVPGGVGVWHEGGNWDSGTPALRQGGARFAGAGNDRVELDESVDTRYVDFESGNVRLNVAGHHLNVRDGLHILQNARVAINTLFDPQNDLIGMVHGNIVNEGTLSPGNSPGLLNLIGDLTNTGTLEFEIAGLDPSEFDRLWISGTFDAGGTLKLLLDGYAPLVGDEFDLLDWGVLNYQGMTIDFSNAILTTGLRWDSTVFASTGSLRVSAIPEPGNLIWLIAASFGFAARRKRRTFEPVVSQFN